MRTVLRNIYRAYLRVQALEFLIRKSPKTLRIPCELGCATNLTNYDDTVYTITAYEHNIIRYEYTEFSDKIPFKCMIAM